MMQTVYLAGPINGLDYSQVTSWRNKASETLTVKGYNVLDPMRGKSVLIDSNLIEDSNSPFKPNYILRRDLWDLQHSDIIIANLEYLGVLPMIGTLMELGLCLDKSKIIYLFNVSENYCNHPFFSKYNIKPTLEEILYLL